MPNLTLSLDETLLRKARKTAFEKKTSLTAMIRKYLESVTMRNQEENKKVIRKLKGFFDSPKIQVGSKYWTRDDLHER